MGVGIGFLEVFYAATETAALVGGEGDEGLAAEVVLGEEGEHDLRSCASRIFVPTFLFLTPFSYLCPHISKGNEL